MTNYQRTLLRMLPLVIKFDIRLQYHSFTEKDGVFEHIERFCPLCAANYLLELSTD